MRVMTATVTCALGLAVVTACGSMGDGDGATSVSLADSNKLNGLEFANGAGTQVTFSDNPKVKLKKEKVKTMPFFTSLGTNGRACVHCHVPANGWGISAASVQYRFSHPLDLANSDCLVDPSQCAQDPNPSNYGASDPIFRTNDGSNAPNANVSTPDARGSAYSMLLTKGLIRVGIGIPSGAEFTLDAVDDPYGYASAKELSLFRRPLPSTNLRLSSTLPDAGAAPTPTLTAVMWDGRETLPGHDILADLLDQANGATLGHAQAIAGLSAADLQAIVDFETGLHTAQATSTAAGDLAANGANGGPLWLAQNQSFYVGINDVLTGDSATHAAFNPDVFSIYSGWSGAASAAQAQIARGEAIFDRKAIAITGVGGLNDALAMDTIPGSCTTCHDAPNYGHHSVRLAIDIGVSNASRRTPDLPLYTLRNVATGAIVKTTDPGRALITGKWADIGKFKGPILRGLSARAPYFHNGSAATLADVVAFYDTRFGIGFTDQEKADLVAFLQAL